MSARAREKTDDDDEISSDWGEWEVVQKNDEISIATEKVITKSPPPRDEEAEEKAHMDLRAEYLKQQEELEERRRELEKERIRYGELWKSYERQNDKSEKTQRELQTLDAKQESDRRELVSTREKYHELQAETQQMRAQLAQLALQQRQMKQEHSIALSSAVSSQQAQQAQLLAQQQAQQQMFFQALVSKTESATAPSTKRSPHLTMAPLVAGTSIPMDIELPSPGPPPVKKPSAWRKRKRENRKKKKAKKALEQQQQQQQQKKMMSGPILPPPPVMPVPLPTCEEIDEFMFTWRCPTCRTQNDESNAFCVSCTAKNDLLVGGLTPPPPPPPASAAAMGGLGGGILSAFDFSGNGSKNGKKKSGGIGGGGSKMGLAKKKNGSGVQVRLTFQGELGGAEPWQPGQERDCGWILKNESRAHLRLAVSLERVQGDPLLQVREEDTRLEYSVKMGEELFVFIRVTAPPVPGSYASQWVLRRKNGEQVGPKMTLNLKVKREFTKKKEDKIRQLVGMGFMIRSNCVAALTANKWDVQEAAITLMEKAANE